MYPTQKMLRIALTRKNKTNTIQKISQTTSKNYKKYVGIAYTSINFTRCRIYQASDTQLHPSKTNDLRIIKAKTPQNLKARFYNYDFYELTSVFQAFVPHVFHMLRKSGWFVNFYHQFQGAKMYDPKNLKNPEFLFSNKFEANFLSPALKYEMKGSLNSIDEANFETQTKKSALNLPEKVTQISTPDQKLLADLISRKDSITIFLPGVMFNDHNYATYLSLLASETNSFIVCPDFTDGSQIYYLDVRNRKFCGYDLSVPFFKNTMARKNQAQHRSAECYQIIDQFRQIFEEFELELKPVHIVGHSFGGMAAVKMMANVEENHKIHKIVSLGGSLEKGG